jgi:hypothetical protein
VGADGKQRRDETMKKRKNLPVSSSYKTKLPGKLTLIKRGEFGRVMREQMEDRYRD